ncbi:MAG: kelch repeat-containing protein [Candidatus Limnocylindrales bacterium]|jgi:N-acetylneuraminic acid mutarotase
MTSSGGSIRKSGGRGIRGGRGTRDSGSGRGTAAILAFDAIALAAVLATAPVAFIWLSGSRPVPPAAGSPQPSASIVLASPATAGAPATETPSATPTATPVPTALARYGSGTWSPLPPMPVSPWDPGVAVLADGRMLVIGGSSGPSSSAALASVEIFDPRLDKWAAARPMLQARAYPATAVLPDGSVLVVGGSRDGLPLASAERYIPGTASWVSAGTMNVPRTHTTATVLRDGRVLVAGGGSEGSPSYRSTAAAEIYDPATGTWTPTAPMAHARALHTATLLPDGEVLVAGGATVYQGTRGTVTASAEIFDPASATWHAAPSMSVARYHYSAVTLSDGRVLVAGGWNLTSNSDQSLASSEIYDPVLNAWTATGSMATGRARGSMTTLPDGRVLIVGGVDPAYRVMATAEIWDAPSGRWHATGRLGTALMGPALAVLHDGRVVLAGGALDAVATHVTPASAIFTPPAP